jgi:hypothetical protein
MLLLPTLGTSSAGDLAGRNLQFFNLLREAEPSFQNAVILYCLIMDKVLTEQFNTTFGNPFFPAVDQRAFFGL